jgi:hypothetical protein
MSSVAPALEDRETMNGSFTSYQKDGNQTMIKSQLPKEVSKTTTSMAAKFKLRTKTQKNQ